MRQYLLGLICILLLSCNGDRSDKKSKSMDEDALYNKVMAVHDAVMPKMSDIHKLKKELRKHLNKEEFKEEILNQLQELEEADDAMMDWMHDLNIPEKEGPERNQYLKKQLNKIEDVSDIMLKSIDNAEKLVAELKV